MARAIYEKRVELYSANNSLSWLRLPPANVAAEMDGARAAIEALKPQLLLSAQDYEFHCRLSSILAEKQP